MTVEAPSTCSPWATVADVCAPCNEYEFDVALLTDMLQVASDILYDLTRRRWAGVCTDTVRPCSRGAGCGCRERARCGCGGLSEVELPGYPVQAVTEVLIDGEVVPPEQYRLDDQRYLVWLRDQQLVERLWAWPCCQRDDLPATERFTWQVAYEYGQEPPLGGVRAAARLGCQLALACSPASSGACQLPRRVTTVVRQGVTVGVVDPLTLFKDGLTGLADVDLWVAATNRGSSQRRATVMVPGSRRRARRAGA